MTKAATKHKPKPKKPPINARPDPQTPVAELCAQMDGFHGPARNPGAWSPGAGVIAEIAEPMKPLADCCEFCGASDAQGHFHTCPMALRNAFDSRFGVGVLLGVCIGLPVGVIALRLLA